ncbi:carboxylesterase family protein [Lacrimispora sp. AGF001]|uniref:carboxylesterase family protein n=1 Tax=Lacrimispora sp. AGF001 TaxID=3401631 RepID=UPI003B42FEDD
MKEITIDTACGKLKGIDSETGVHKFSGIRYATAGRWEYPVEVTRWDGVFDATRFKDAGIQRRTFYKEQEESFYYKEFRKDDVYTYSEDCFYLNIWKPECCKEAPVIFYVHGGMFQGGCGNEKPFDGSGYAQKGVIFVTCNYRLGPFGFCSLPELEKRDGHTGNYGLYDQLTALKWIYHNIERFGGDPSNITVMGQSAGAMSLQQLCMTPLAKEYISKAIMTSGGGVSETFANATYAEKTYPFWNEVLSQVGTSLTEWIECDAKDLLDSMFAVMQKYPNGIQNCMPVIDRGIVPFHTDEMITKGMQAKIPYMMGSTKDDLLPEEMHRMAKDWTILQSEQGLIPSYCFYFSRNLPGDEKGSWHSSELWYTIGALENCWRPWEEKDYQLSDVMMEYFSNFAKRGNPNGESLPEWRATSNSQDDIMVFSDTEIGMNKIVRS